MQSLLIKNVATIGDQPATVHDYEPSRVPLGYYLRLGSYEELFTIKIFNSLILW